MIRKYFKQLQALGKRISKLRKARGMTIERLAVKAKLSKGNLSDIERGNKDPRFLTSRAIANGLGLALSDLFKGF